MVEIKLKTGIAYNINEIKSVTHLEGNRIELIANLDSEESFRTFILNTQNITKKSMKTLNKYLKTDRVGKFLDW
jgi:hypothetical protein